MSTKPDIIKKGPKVEPSIGLSPSSSSSPSFPPSCISGSGSSINFAPNLSIKSPARLAINNDGFCTHGQFPSHQKTASIYSN
ncbi:hypothetical protein PoB_003759400 [Plakobranchus ocellatus]|uniref:Uncharacterized protein n=1 Tax=Plakobranchus ocellatus TaxID=259542 RepID=A0AAV4ATF6_9GAST|nr:hypothetical protein PoB_003759400 [Plakobranchus ocellatus]